VILSMENNEFHKDLLNDYSHTLLAKRNILRIHFSATVEKQTGGTTGDLAISCCSSEQMCLMHDYLW
jgi:hypothetical protein